MSIDGTQELQLEIAHVLFIDIVGYSKLLINEQHDSLQELNQIVRSTETFRAAEAAEKLIRLPTGDGMARAFSTTPDAPVQCALEISQALKSRPHIPVRMGVHSGPVSGIVDVNDRSNVAGAGINMAQRIMDCGDAGHILLSKRVAEDLAQYRQWQAQLHDLGECQVKHNVPLSVVNLYTAELGNPEVPEKFKHARAEQAGGVDPSSPSRRRNNALVIGAAALLLGLAMGFWFYTHRPPPTSTAPAPTAASSAAALPEKSIAVLPFENLSSDKENAYFTDGVQDEILTDLAKIADLKVISRTSVMQYKSGAARNLREIGQQLGVALLVEGSVQRAGNKVRVNAQLIDARTDGHLWAQVYDRPLDDVFAIQSEIAQTIADQLTTKVSAAEKAAIAERPTSNLRAYELYTEANELLTVYISARNSDQTVLRAVELLNQAVALDPAFHLAYCRLAQAHENIWFYSIDRTPARIELAKGAVDAAVRLRPALGETHLAQAFFVYFIHRDFATAARELAIALRTMPNSSDALFLSGLIARRTGRWEEALAYERRAQLIDPRNLDIMRSVADILYTMRRYAEDEKILHRALETVPESAAIIYAKLTECALAAGDLAKAKEYCALIPPDWNTHGYGSFYRWMTALYTHDFAAALTIAQSAPEPMPDSLNGGQMQNAKGYFVGQVARAQNNENLAQTAFAEARPEAQKQSSGDDVQAPVFLSILARIDAALGNKEAAIAEARRAVELRPNSKDAAQGPDLETSLAGVYAWTDERDLAFQHLEHVTRSPSGATYGDLKFNPRWDSLRGDPRFEELLAGLAPKESK